MANENIWYPDVNFAIADSSTAQLTAKSTLWLIQALLIGDVGTATQGRWSLYASSDSVTAGTDSTKRWGATFDATKIVRAAEGTAHSWAVYQSPSALGPLYMTIDYSTPVDNLWFVYFSKMAPTGGSITARPTSAIEWMAVDNSTNYENQFVGNVAVAHRVSVHRTVAGHFALMVQKAGSGRFDGFFGLMPLAETRAGDMYPYLSIFEPIMSYSSILTMYSSPTYNARSVSSTNGTQASSRCFTRSANGAVVHRGALTAPCCGIWGSGTNDPVFSALVPSSDASDGKVDDFPAYFAASGGYLKGRVQDMKWCPSNIVEGTLDDGASLGSPQSTVAGDMWVPWTSATAPFL